jgi:hypothetical protein
VLTAVAIAVAMVASLALAQLASAAANPVATGAKTTITLNSGLFNKLKKAKVKVSAVAPATVSGKVITLPVKVGSLDVAGVGELEHEGGIQLKAGKKKVKVTEFVLSTSTGSLNAKVGSKVLKFASVSGLSAARNGFGTNVTVSALKLTGKAATELNKKLGLKKPKKKKHKRHHKRASVSKKKKKAAGPVFKGNQVFGSSFSETQPKTIGITPTGDATLNIDLSSGLKLLEVNVKESVIPPAQEVSALPPVVNFPLTGGTISPDGKQGSVQTGGGLLLKQEPKAFPGKENKVTLKNIWLELTTGRATVEVVIESNVEFPPGSGTFPANLGNFGRASIATLDMSGATITADPATHTVKIENGKAFLEETTATVLNEVFGTFEGKKPFKGGDPLGTFSFTATTE